MFHLEFNRKEYLERSKEFEGSVLDCVDDELSEMNYDIEDLAYELAYTRYALAVSELGDTKLINDNAALKFVLKSILDNLPQRRDWLNPGIERLARELVKEEGA